MVLIAVVAFAVASVGSISHQEGTIENGVPGLSFRKVGEDGIELFVARSPVDAASRPDFPAPSRLMIVVDPMFSDELRLTSSQKREIEDAVEILADYYSSIADDFNKEQESDPRGAQRRIQLAQQDRQKSVEEFLQGCLSAAQNKRIDQLRLQKKIPFWGPIKTIETLSAEVDLTSSETKQLLEESAAIQKELDDQIFRLRQAARKKLLSKFPDRTKSTLDDLIGREFDFGHAEVEVNLEPK